MLIGTGIEHETDMYVKKYPEITKVFKLSSLNLEETGLIVRTSLGLSEIPYKLTHRLMIENQGKASVTKRMIKKLWYDGTIFFDEKTMSWNLDEVDDSFNFDYVDHKREDFDVLINTLDRKYYEVLRKLSILKGSFSMPTIFIIAGIEEEFGYYFLYEMEERHILNKRISDVEYVFGFTTNELKKAFFDTLAEDEVVSLSEMAAKYYETRFLEHGDIHESLIDYLLASNQALIAASYCVTFSEIYLERANNHKAVDLLEQAVDIYLISHQDTLVFDNVMKMIKQLIKMGKLDKAMERIEFLYGFILENNLKSKVDIQLEHAYILYFKNDITMSESIADEALATSHDIEYIDGEFRAAFVKCKCLISKGDTAAHKTISDYYLAESNKKQLTYQIGRAHV